MSDYLLVIDMQTDYVADGNGCVNGSLPAVLDLGYQVTVDLSKLGVENQKKFQKTLTKWKQVGVKVKGELS